MVTADLVHPKGNRLILIGVLALDHQYGNAVDEKDDVLADAEVAVVKGPLLGNFVNVVASRPWPLCIPVIDQDQVALAVLFVVEELGALGGIVDDL